MRTQPTAIPDVVLVVPQPFTDTRGYFMQAWQAENYAAAGIASRFVQDNHSHSRRGVLRGLHYQSQQPQGKLVYVVMGEVFDVAVDLRRSSPTFGRWAGARLSGENHHQMWIPPGFAHGFYTISESADVLYKCTDYYAPAHEHTLLWNDPEVGIEWPLTDPRPLLSDKDARGKPLREAWCFP
jgi:dTDP-4-dehydrorhamnose 3,5-epimerase